MERGKIAIVLLYIELRPKYFDVYMHNKIIRHYDYT